MELIEKKLVRLLKSVINDATKDESFELEDYAVFGEITAQISSIKDLKLKPYLITWHINKWEYFADLIYDSLEILGYEYIGNMDYSNGNYLFECDDIHYEILFRYKNIECDYTNHLKFKE